MVDQTLFGRRAPAIAVCVLGVTGTSVGAESTTLTAVRDNSINSVNVGNSGGASRFVFAGRTGEPGKEARLRALLHFDVTGRLDPGALVTSVTFTLTLEQAAPDSGPRTLGLHRLLADWGEGASDAFGGDLVPAEPDDATWEHRFFPDVFWTAEGGDFEPAASAERSVGEETGAYTWTSTPTLVDDVQSWLDGTAPEYGWLLRGEEDVPFTARKFASRETFNLGTEPTLTICYLDSPCGADLDASGDVGFSDVLAVITAWGSSGPADLDCSGIVDTTDLFIILQFWGPCR